MGFWDFFRRKKPEQAKVIEAKTEEFIEKKLPLYGGLVDQVTSPQGSIVGFIIGAAILEIAKGIFWAVLESGSAGYSYAHDWEGKRRLARFKWHFQRRRAWRGHNRNGRASLKSLGWIVMSVSA